MTSEWGPLQGRSRADRLPLKFGQPWPPPRLARWCGDPPTVPAGARRPAESQPARQPPLGRRGRAAAAAGSASAATGTVLCGLALAQLEARCSCTCSSQHLYNQELRQRPRCCCHRPPLLAPAAPATARPPQLRLPVQGGADRRQRCRQVQPAVALHAQRVLAGVQVDHRRRVRHPQHTGARPAPAAHGQLQPQCSTSRLLWHAAGATTMSCRWSDRRVAAGRADAAPPATARRWTARRSRRRSGTLPARCGASCCFAGCCWPLLALLNVLGVPAVWCAASSKRITHPLPGPAGAVPRHHQRCVLPSGAGDCSWGPWSTLQRLKLQRLQPQWRWQLVLEEAAQQAHPPGEPAWRGAACACCLFLAAAADLRAPVPLPPCCSLLPRRGGRAAGVRHHQADHV